MQIREFMCTTISLSPALYRGITDRIITMCCSSIQIGKTFNEVISTINLLKKIPATVAIKIRKFI